MSRGRSWFGSEWCDFVQIEQFFDPLCLFHLERSSPVWHPGNEKIMKTTEIEEQAGAELYKAQAQAQMS